MVRVSRQLAGGPVESTFGFWVFPKEDRPGRFFFALGGCRAVPASGLPDLAGWVDAGDAGRVEVERGHFKSDLLSGFGFAAICSEGLREMSAGSLPIRQLDLEESRLQDADYQPFDRDGDFVHGPRMPPVGWRASFVTGRVSPWLDLPESRSKDTGGPGISGFQPTPIPSDP